MSRAEGDGLSQLVIVRLMVFDEFGLFAKIIHAKGFRCQSNAAAAAVAVIGVDIDLVGQGAPLLRKGL